MGGPHPPLLGVNLISFLLRPPPLDLSPWSSSSCVFSFHTFVFFFSPPLPLPAMRGTTPVLARASFWWPSSVSFSSLTGLGPASLAKVVHQLGEGAGTAKRRCWNGLMASLRDATASDGAATTGGFFWWNHRWDMLGVKVRDRQKDFARTTSGICWNQ